ncbi:unnamed protein product [Lupinus luteus]|uniref:Uncharacterized protein n=1 Tax=Lupinus luteus TaxID=3873 RepID=A0AAV1VUM6_LUPLU
MQQATPEDAVAGALSGDSGRSLTRRQELMAAAAEKRMDAVPLFHRRLLLRRWLILHAQSAVGKSCDLDNHHLWRI